MAEQARVEQTKAEQLRTEKPKPDKLEARAQDNRDLAAMTI
jgi:hypothetical protein